MLWYEVLRIFLGIFLVLFTNSYIRACTSFPRVREHDDVRASELRTRAG